MVHAPSKWFDHTQYVVVGTDGRVRRTVDVPMGMSMLHDMSLTEKHAVVYDLPVTVDLGTTNRDRLNQPPSCGSVAATRGRLLDATRQEPLRLSTSCSVREAGANPAWARHCDRGATLTRR